MRRFDRDARLTVWLFLLAMGMAMVWFPPSLDRIWRTVVTMGENIPMGGTHSSRFHAILHGHPTDACVQHAEKRNDLLRRAREEIQRLRQEEPFELVRSWNFIRFWRTHAPSLIHLPCPEEGWRFNETKTWWLMPAPWLEYYRFLPDNAPLLWAVGRLALTEVDLILGLLLASWLGIGVLYLLGRRLSGSHLVGLVGVGVALLLMKQKLYVLPPALHMLNPWQWSILFIPIWAVIHMAWPDPSSPWPRREWLSRLAMVPVLGAGSLVLLFVYPAFHQTNTRLLLIALLVGALLARRGRIALLALLALLAVNAAHLPYQRFNASLLAPWSDNNYGQGSMGARLYLTQGMMELPNAYAIPHGDYGFNPIFRHDPLVYDRAPQMTVHQSGPGWVDHYFSDLMTHRWHEYVEVVARRLASQIVFAEENTFDLIASWGKWLFFYPMLVLLGGSLLLGLGSAGMLPVWPLMALILADIFAVHTFIYGLHHHNLYLLSGLFLLLSLFPGLVIFPMRGRGVSWRMEGSRWRRAGVLSVTGISAAGVLLFVGTVWPEERNAFILRFRIHAGTAIAKWYPEPAFIDQSVADLLSRDRNRDGAMEMYAAWIYLSYEQRLKYYQKVMTAAGHPLAVDELRRTALQQVQRYYRQALQKGTDNPHIAFNALLIGAPDWPEIFRHALERHPAHFYSAYGAFHLLQSLPAGDPERGRWIRLFEEAQHRLWLATRQHRPGYRPLPELALAPTRAPVLEGEELRLELAPGEEVALEAMATLNSPELTTLLYARLQQGDGEIHLAGENGEFTTVPQPLPATDAPAYLALETKQTGGAQHARVHLRAGREGAVVMVRDLYPLVTRPRLRPILPLEPVR